MASIGIELLALVVIVGSVTFGSLRFLLDLYSVYKDLIGRSLLLGLEFLVAADVIRTVALELTPRNIGMRVISVMLAKKRIANGKKERTRARWSSLLPNTAEQAGL